MIELKELDKNKNQMETIFVPHNVLHVSESRYLRFTNLNQEDGDIQYK